MNKKIGLVAAIVFIAITEIFIMKLSDKREIKFEDFKSSEKLQEYLEQEFPKNSSASELVSFLKKSEVKCTTIHKEKSGLTLPEGCEYSAEIRNTELDNTHRFKLLSQKAKEAGDSRFTELYANLTVQQELFMSVFGAIEKNDEDHI